MKKKKSWFFILVFTLAICQLSYSQTSEKVKKKTDPAQAALKAEQKNK